MKQLGQYAAPRRTIAHLADQGEPGAYATLRPVVEPAATAMDAIVVWTMSNHDARAAYARGLFDTDDDGCQEAGLADVLSTPAEHGTLLAMHHPPLPLPTSPFTN